MVFNAPYLENELGDPPCNGLLLLQKWIFPLLIIKYCIVKLLKKEKMHGNLLGADVLDPLCGNLTHGIA